MRTWILALAVSGAMATGCLARPGPPPQAVQPDPTEQDLEAVDRAIASARQHPDERRYQRSAGLAAVRATLVGNFQYRTAAEEFLERAYRLDPDDELVARSLGRFLNLRVTERDFSRAHLQAEVYDRLAKGRATDPQSMSREVFTFACFRDAAQAVDAWDRGRYARAYRKVVRLEGNLQRRVLAHPGEIDSYAMAGNYVRTFAGLIPWGRKRRLRQAIAYYERQQAQWERQTLGAQGRLGVGPNTRAVFTFDLAETLREAGDRDRARYYYEQLQHIERGETEPRKAVRWVARQRLDQLDQLDQLDHGRARRGLMSTLSVTPWPVAAASCVACHSQRARLGIDPGALAHR